MIVNLMYIAKIARIDYTTVLNPNLTVGGPSEVCHLRLVQGW
jgi:hypothetical protein